jgi:hypothetical protein
MKKKKEPKRGVSSKMVVATVALLAIQGVPKYLHAQREAVDNSRESEQQKQDLFIKFANTRLAKQKLDVIGLINGTPVLKSSDNKIYLMDPQTADIRQVTMEEYNKLSYNKVSLVNKIYSVKDRSIKLDGLKLSQKVREGEQALRNQVVLLGVDKDGHEIFQTARGQKFFFDPATGDMVDYIGHVALIK